MLSCTTLASVMSAALRTVSRLSVARAICAAMSPGCCGSASPLTDVWPETRRTREWPVVSMACEKPNWSCHFQGLIFRFCSGMYPPTRRMAIEMSPAPAAGDAVERIPNDAGLRTGLRGVAGGGLDLFDLVGVVAVVDALECGPLRAVQVAEDEVVEARLGVRRRQTAVD